MSHLVKNMVTRNIRFRLPASNVHEVLFKGNNPLRCD